MSDAPTISDRLRNLFATNNASMNNVIESNRSMMDRVDSLIASTDNREAWERERQINAIFSNNNTATISTEHVTPNRISPVSSSSSENIPVTVTRSQLDILNNTSSARVDHPLSNSNVKVKKKVSFTPLDNTDPKFDKASQFSGILGMVNEAVAAAVNQLSDVAIPQQVLDAVYTDLLQYANKQASLNQVIELDPLRVVARQLISERIWKEKEIKTNVSTSTSNQPSAPPAEEIKDQKLINIKGTKADAIKKEIIGKNVVSIPTPRTIVYNLDLYDHTKYPVTREQARKMREGQSLIIPRDLEEAQELIILCSEIVEVLLIAPFKQDVVRIKCAILAANTLGLINTIPTGNEKTPLLDGPALSFISSTRKAAERYGEMLATTLSSLTFKYGIKLPKVKNAGFTEYMNMLVDAGVMELKAKSLEITDKKTQRGILGDNTDIGREAMYIADLTLYGVKTPYTAESVVTSAVSNKLTIRCTASVNAFDSIDNPDVTTDQVLAYIRAFQPLLAKPVLQVLSTFVDVGGRTLSLNELRRAITLSLQ